MSGTRKIWNAGEGATTTELQRAADVAASADDAVTNVLATPVYADGVYDKRVIPLYDDAPRIDGYHFTDRRLVRTGALDDGIRVGPAQYVAGAAGSGEDATAVLLAATQLATTVLDPTALFPSGVSLPRIDLLYAFVTRTGTTASKTVQDPATGLRSTQVLTVATTPTVAFGVVHGVESATPVAPDPPGDSATAWYFPLATVALDDGMGGPWVASSDLTGRVTQAWAGGWIRANRVQALIPANWGTIAYAPGANGAASTPLSDRWGSRRTFGAVLQHAANDGSPVKLDDTLDYRLRVVEVKVLKFAINPSAPDTVPPEGAGGYYPNEGSDNAQSGPCWTGDGQSGPFWTSATSGTGAALPFDVDPADGALLTTLAFDPSSGGSFDVYWLEWVVSDPFVF